MTGLKIAPTLELPMEAVTETFVILAKRGSGKTYTAAVLAEEIIGAGHPCVVIDPIGVWWGLRSSADGNTAGLPIVIFGGDHADVPLDEHSGTIIADAIVAERFSAIIDLSLLSKAKARIFMTAFIERMYHANRDPLHMIVDEADAFAPQRTAGEGARLLGAMEDLVRRGRARGIGCTLITQRPAVLNKDVLTQAEVLICLRMNGVRDVAAIDEWVRLHADDEEAAVLKKSLPSLPIGTAWVWSPGWLGLLERVQIRTRRTFDSSATPAVGQKRVIPKQMADIDLDALGAKITATVEDAKANDPKALRNKVSQLERELANALEATKVETVEVPVLTEDNIQRLEAAYDSMTRAYNVWSDQLAETVPIIDDVFSQTTLLREAIRKPGPAPLPGRAAAIAGRRHDSTRFAQSVAPAVPGPSRSEPSGDGSLPKAQRLILEVLIQYGDRTVQQVALLTGYSSKGGGFRNALGALRSAGLIAGGKDLLQITEEGVAAAGDVPELPQGEALLDHWRASLPKASKLILNALVDAYPTPLTIEELADATEYAPTGGGFRNALGKMRTLGLLIGNRDGMTVPEEIGYAHA